MNNSMIHQPLTINSLIEHASQYHGDTEIISVETDRQISRSNWSTTHNNALKLSSALGTLGVVPGDRVATIAWNNRRHLELYFGVSCGGMVCHTINPRLFPEQLVYIINHAQDKALFIDETFIPLVAKLRNQLTTVEHIVLMGAKNQEAAGAIDGILFYDDLLESADKDFVWADIDENAPSSLCYTSGTTGNPKGVLYKHRTTVLHSLGGNQPDGIAISAMDSVMPVVPMFHVNAWGVPYIAAMVGCKLVFPGPGLDGASLVKLIDDEQVSLALGVPTIWQGLLGALEESGSVVASLKRTVVGGSALPPSMISDFRDKYDVDLIHAWGMTEISPLGTMNQLLQKHTALTPDEQAQVRLGQGRPPFGVQMRLVDLDNNVLPNDGETQGALQIRGYWVVDTYFLNDTSALTEDGWFDTGDIATIDSDGYMIIRDRAKDIIKSGGEWISTVELENIAIAHPDVSGAAVIAAAHKKWDERPVLVAVKAEGKSPTEEQLLAFYENKIASWQVPDKVVFVESLPLGGTGKVLKSVLREEYGSILINGNSG